MLQILITFRYFEIGQQLEKMWNFESQFHDKNTNCNKWPRNDEILLFQVCLINTEQQQHN